LESGILFPALTADYAYAWSTGETTHSIEVSKEGDYTVVVTNEAGCSETRTCNVTLSYLAKIQNIIVHDLLPSNNVVIEVTNLDDYNYMIQFENGSTTALQSSNTFVNIPGFHELIVENKDGCGLVKEVLQYYKQQHSLRQMETALMITGT
jgi:hypothetical protein